MRSTREVPFYSAESVRAHLCPRSQRSKHPAGLLTYGSPYSPRLPVSNVINSGVVRISSPNTAAGLSPIPTEFPIKLSRAPGCRFQITAFNELRPFGQEENRTQAQNNCNHPIRTAKNCLILGSTFSPILHQQLDKPYVQFYITIRNQGCRIA